MHNSENCIHSKQYSTELLCLVWMITLYRTAVFLDNIVIPRSRSMSLLSMMRSCVCWLALNTLLCLSIESTCKVPQFQLTLQGQSQAHAQQILWAATTADKAASEDHIEAYQGGLAMVDVSNDSNVADVMFVCQDVTVFGFLELP